MVRIIAPGIDPFIDEGSFIVGLGDIGPREVRRRAWDIFRWDGSGRARLWVNTSREGASRVPVASVDLVRGDGRP